MVKKNPPNMTVRISTKTEEYKSAEAELRDHFEVFSKLLPPDETIANLGLFITPQERRREFFSTISIKSSMD